jgi:hypothetical protein
MIPRSTAIRRTLRHCPRPAFAVPRQTPQIRWNTTRAEPIETPAPEKTIPSDPKGSLIKLIKDSIKVRPLPLSPFVLKSILTHFRRSQARSLSRGTCSSASAIRRRGTTPGTANLPASMGRPLRPQRRGRACWSMSRRMCLGVRGTLLPRPK